MMQKILEALANGNLQVMPQSMDRNSEMGHSIERICELEKDLDNILDDTEKALLQKLLDAKNDTSDNYAAERFISGFRLGVLLMVEVFAGNDSLITD